MSGLLRSFFNNAEEIFCAAIMVFMTLLGFANVVARYAGYSLAFTEELLVMAMVWLTLFGAAVGFKRGAHLGLGFFKEALPAPLQKIFDIAAASFTVGTVGLVVYLCVVYQIPDEIAMRTSTPALDIPQAYYTLAIPIGGAAVIIRVVQTSWRIARETARRP
ncbi:MAG: TRAP transporter small permease [Desulfomonile tiedjei]|nr:TRAP transporter small permease [Desulfomonile tiedjei]